MSRWIDAEYCEDFFDRWESRVKNADPVTIDVVQNTRTLLRDAPSIDLADYVPKDFHDKTCEAMAKRHADEIASMPDIVRCKECRYAEACEQMVVFENGKYITSGYKLDYCSYGEREEP